MVGMRQTIDTVTSRAVVMLTSGFESMAGDLQGTGYRSRGDGNTKDDVRFLFACTPLVGCAEEDPFQIETTVS
jgi:hypothetical protein